MERSGGLLEPERSGSPERRSFVMHHSLLRDVIRRQAGSLPKAILEGVMNLVEAGATWGEVTLTPTRVTIRDNGRGFESRQEIYEAFEVFGKSDERRHKAGRWAEFQMGRGQLMSYGRTTYRTHSFEMIVDIANEHDGRIGYVLQDGLPEIDGCQITVDLYHPLDDYEIGGVVDDAAQAIRYVDVPITINRSVVTIDPATEAWDHEDENAYYRWSVGAKDEVAIYNLGVLVNEKARWGMGGLVVSKKRLTLNFARNEVLDSCPVGKSIFGEFRRLTGLAVLAKRTPSARDVQAIVRGWREGRFSLRDVSAVPLLRDTNGKRISPFELILRFGGRGVRDPLSAFAVDAPKSARADFAMKARSWLILDREHIAEGFRVPLGRLVSARSLDDLGDCAALLRAVQAHEMRYRSVTTTVEEAFAPCDALYDTLDFKANVVPDTKLKRDESAILTALRDTDVNDGIAEIVGQPPRKLAIGVWDGTRAWTDGEWIVFDRQFIERCIKSDGGLLELLLVMVHEYTHNSRNPDGHDAAFYEDFHDAAMYAAPLQARIISSIMRVGNSRNQRFVKVARKAVEAQRRLARDVVSRDAGVIMPCPLCTFYGGTVWVPIEGTFSGERVLGASGVAYELLRRATMSDDAFRIEFGWRLDQPLTFRGGSIVVCPVCEDGVLTSDDYAEVKPAWLRRLLQVAVQSVVAGEEASSRRE